MNQIYVPVAIESIEPDAFPSVDLFLKTGENTYVLYKSHDLVFTHRDSSRLEESGVDFLFVRHGDMEIITEYMESNAGKFLDDPRYDSRTKGKIIFQTTINYVGDIFEHPEKAADLDRSKRLMENLFIFLSKDSDVLSSLETVMNHNFYVFVHSLQVAALSILVSAEAYTLCKDELIDVGLGGILHDIGKTLLPAAILQKEGKLTPDEVAAFKEHPENGYQQMKKNSRLGDVPLSIIRHHHERANGTGYPSGLTAERIPRSAQVAGLCDVYCLMTLDRSGKKALPPHLTIQLMRQEMAPAFNQKLVDTLEKIVCDREQPQIIL